MLMILNKVQKKMFILYKTTIDLNIKQNILKRNINEILFNNINIINKKIQQKI